MDNNQSPSHPARYGKALAISFGQDQSSVMGRQMILSTEQLDQTVDRLCCEVGRLLDSRRSGELYAQLSLGGETPHATADRLMTSANSLSELARLLTDAAIRIARNGQSAFRA
jgi:hypothetical protein